MGEKKGYKFGLRKKLVLFITSLAIITYTTSAVFLYFLFPSIEEVLPFGEAVFTILTLGMGIFWSGVLAFFAAGFIIKPLQKLEKTALMAANGDIGQDAELSKSDDEIRSLGIAFNHMLFNLRDMVQKIDENFKETNEKVIAMSSESSAAAEQADSIARTISEISQGADSSAVSIQSTAESMEDVLRIAQEVQDTAKASQNVSGEMVQDLMESKKVIHSLISGIEKLAQDNEESLQTVKRLEQNAVKVEQIIQLVGDIAAQTNLLALNASIEAARAGDHGKGFAVVAEEVRKLADESAKAVQGISELIQNIQEEVRNVVTQISYQVETANNEVKKGTKTNEVIEEMAKVVNEMAASVSAISGLVDSQMEGIQHTSTQSQEVAAIAEETSAGAQEVSAATQHQTAVIGNVEKLAIELKEQAEKLNSTITKFKL
ncbi:chemotaxis protein [Cytobacillus firmus]|uniref:methyl-accepting chemotaxis protein n=1 Tax=Cytobacillus firmus TaxID=1399 RepID=UPI00157FE827|nr:HAMP domain-containing methyl-accepting chemotaxis protein [Cytobacillus firmus]MBG9541929.1 chemotaxis protein [Cytobacillus firmus]MBG9546648.1 chemotaxis protein [Cytobacillus firmus]MBG9551095.1 chemotaxis protein [Cytobacillus firmus]MBG9575347.1 chemotaxis protein [Cytobacillus firmus]MBG9601303.1 chemotaxis protein [Cytobacillus firmus]